MKYTAFLFVFFISLFSSAQSYLLDIDKAEEVSRNAVEQLKAKDYDKIFASFDTNLKAKLSYEEIEKRFMQTHETHGNIEKIIDFGKKTTAESTSYLVGVLSEKTKFDIAIDLNESYHLTSILLKPYSYKDAWKKPAYVNEENFKVEPIKIGDEMPLLGEFTKSKIEGALTIVVMVHGSGPNDMDESLGPNKIFKDLAYGLASQGISSIRYNKRTYDYPGEMSKYQNSITIDQLLVNDALKAIETARKLGAKKVILIGHSLGGHLAPKIASKTTLEGVIVLAGNASPLIDLILPQFEYLLKNDSTTSINEFHLNTLKYQINKIKSGNYDSLAPGGVLPLGLPGSFWFSLKDYKPKELSKKQTQPYLILNGERDYQVTKEEAKKWKNGNKHKASKTIIYPQLNHLFFAGEGLLLPSEYENKAHFDERVLKDIVQWIKLL